MLRVENLSRIFNALPFYLLITKFGTFLTDIK